MNTPTLSVVIPAYNEEKDIRSAILDVVRVYPQAEIIVIDDASTDRTPKILLDIKRTVPALTILTNTTNKGHGYSVVLGLRAARNEYILYIDADRQMQFDGLYPDGTIDFISGYRMKRQDKLFRKVISFCLKTTNLLYHRMYIKDANCPLKFYRRTALLPLLNRLPTTYIVPIACLEVLARKYDFTTSEIGVTHKPYDGVRKGFLQILNKSAMHFFYSAFLEVTSL